MPPAGVKSSSASRCAIILGACLVSSRALTTCVWPTSNEPIHSTSCLIFSSMNEHLPTAESHVHIGRQHSSSVSKGQIGSVTGDSQYSVGERVGSGVGSFVGGNVLGLTGEGRGFLYGEVVGSDVMTFAAVALGERVLLAMISGSGGMGASVVVNNAVRISSSGGMGAIVGYAVNSPVGVGKNVSTDVGGFVGFDVGLGDGFLDGFWVVGFWEGIGVGSGVSCSEGEGVGSGVFFFVGSGVASLTEGMGVIGKSVDSRVGYFVG
mmetsp:Transcript_29780/g.63166  ORF Transcript_29780/g.63166 Transcript_29780/m.63166 type:complete len:264 (+) Transcript_29780:3179-3970(+)